MRPTGSQAGDVSGKNDAEIISATSEPSTAPVFTVEFRRDDQLLSSEEVTSGGVPLAVPTVENGRFLGWTTEDGSPADPARTAVTEDTVYCALVRPILREGGNVLFPDERGFLRPDEAFTGEDAARALESLAADTADVQKLLDRFRAAPQAVLSPADLYAVTDALFTPEEIYAVWRDADCRDLPEITRAQAGAVFARLLGRSAREDVYFPDLSPLREEYAALTGVPRPGEIRMDELRERALDGFLWFDGYLYRLNEDGYFVMDETVDGLYYGPDGQYTSGDAELDQFVAETLLQYMTDDQPRLEYLRAVYYHVKNDFRYLVRNYYASGETGWEIPEALTMYRTGKGNCYNFTGAFWSMARGLGYNARTWSGTMGTRDQPHSWTEITLDGQVYICDPEIELNYWLLENYTDNFMMRIQDSYGWNYQAVGRN